MRKRLRVVIASVITMVMATQPLCVFASSSAMNIEYHGPAEIINYLYSNWGVMAQPFQYERMPDLDTKSDPGALTTNTLNSAIATTNFIRHIAGLGEVSLDNNNTYSAQCAAYINGLNGNLNHYPTNPGAREDIYQQGYEGAGKSNLAAGVSDLNSAVKQWMDDPGSNNLPVGHRRWILYPYLEKTTFGASTGIIWNNYYSMYVVNGYRSQESDDIHGVAWPARNMPVEYFTNSTWYDDFWHKGAWSISFGTTIDRSKVSVDLTHVNTGNRWHFEPGDDVYNSCLVHSGYGQNGCVIFRPGIDSYNHGDVYEVTVNGIDSNVYPETSITYRVNFFSLGAVQPSSGVDIGSEGDMYRLYNKNSSEHFYTGSIVERDNLVIAGWNYEDIAWNAPTNSGDPVYRLYNPNTGDHHYTLNSYERDMLVNVGWNFEGEAWKSSSNDSVPVYRLYNPNFSTGSHHYTKQIGERDYLTTIGWKDEGIAWYATK